MPYRQDLDTGEWIEVDAQGNPVRPSAGQVIANPTAPYEAPKAEADLTNLRLQALERQLEIERLRQEQGQAATEAEQEQAAGESKSLRQRLRMGNILSVVQEIRQLAQQGGTGYSSLLAGLPETNARSLAAAIKPIQATLAFDRLQEMRDESKTGGALGQVSERELDLLGAAVASLDPGLSKEQFLANLDRIERHFVGSQMALSGVDPYSDDGAKVFQEYGVKLPEEPVALAGPNARSTRGEIPPAYQAEHLAYLEQNWGRIDPQDYARFRSGLDVKYGFNPDPIAYASAGGNYNEFAASGGAPEALGAVPGPEIPLNPLERGISNMAQIPMGAFATNMANAGALGLPARLGGAQDALGALREQNPGTSLAGEVFGGVTGTLGLGGGLKAAANTPKAGRAASLLANPATANVGFGATYGATQDDNPWRGAGVGAAAALTGDVAGRYLGRSLPRVFNRGGVAAADTTVPSNADLRQQAKSLYTQAEQTGEVATAEQTAELANRLRSVLQRESVISPKGRFTANMPDVKAASALIRDYAGERATPSQLEAVRKRVTDGVVSQNPNEARIASILRDELDNWSAETVEQAAPIYGQARRTASRYLQDDTIQQALDLAGTDVSRLTQSGRENALRSRFRDLQRGEIRGRENFTPAVSEAVATTAQGTPLGNAFRYLGSFAPVGVVQRSAAVGVPFGIGTAIGGPVAGGLAAAGTAGLGMAGRAASTAATSRNAHLASLLARGGPEYEILLETARQEAARRGGRIGAGLFGSSASPATR